MATIEPSNPVFYDVSNESSHDVGVSSEQLETGYTAVTKTAMNTFDDSNIAFLKRDTLIASRKWTTTETNWQFDPWDVLASNTAVAQRLNYLTYLETGGLRVTIRINGSPYYPGRLGVCWSPFNQLDYTVGASAFDIVQLSSKPLFLMIDTTKDATYEMIIPQVRQSKMKVRDQQVWGRLIFFDVAKLRSISSSSTVAPSVDISVFAAMVDPKAFIKTSQKSFYGTSGEARGVISAPLSKIAGFASVMTKTPVIGEYMTGIGMAASLGSTIASKFGFSKQPDLAPVVRAYPELVPNMANTLGVDGAPSLTFDPAVATSLDKSVAGGTNEDELAMSRFTRAWGLTSTSTSATPVAWNVTDVVGANIISIRANPFYGSTNQNVYANPCSRTPICFAADLHKYWTGGLEFRFTFPVTQFHTGRCQFYFDQNANPSTIDITNLCYNVIMDLSVSNSVTMVIPYSGFTPWLARATNLWGKAQNSASIGYIHCKILNAMRAGGGHADSAPCLVEIRGAEDFMLAGPTMEYCRDGTYDCSYHPESVPTVYTEKAYSYYGTSDQAYAVAEPVVSFRQHLKRYTATTIGVPPSVAGNFNYRCMRDLPIPPGYIRTAAGVIRRNNVPWSAMTALMGCYVGARGGTRHLIIPNSGFVRPVFINALDYVSDTMIGDGKLINSGTNLILFSQNVGMSGGQVYMPSQSLRVMRYASMQRSEKLFHYCFDLADADYTAAGVMFNGVGDSPNELTHYTSAADDFDLIQFKGIPVLSYYSNPVAALLPSQGEENEGLAPTVFELRDYKESLQNPNPLPLERSESGLYGPHYTVDEEQGVIE